MSWRVIRPSILVFYSFLAFFRAPSVLGKIRTKLVKYQAGLHVNSFNKVYLIYPCGEMHTAIFKFSKYLSKGNSYLGLWI